MALVERLKDRFAWVTEHFNCRPATMWIPKYCISCIPKGYDSHQRRLFVHNKH